MRHVPYEIPFPHVGIGQDDDWVRANFTNATDILAVGYIEGNAPSRTASVLACAATHRTASALTGGMVTAIPPAQTPPVRALAVRFDALAVRCVLPSIFSTGVFA